MKNEKYLTGIVVCLSIVVIIMSVGYAAFTSDLNIGGTATVKASKWQVKFLGEGEGGYVETADSQNANPKEITDNNFTFTVELPNPGDFYETTLQVKNAGTLKAQLSSINMNATASPADVNMSQYFKYSIKVGEHEYLESKSNITDSKVLNPNDTENVVVRIDYILPGNADDLPAQDETITVSGVLNYKQVE